MDKLKFRLTNIIYGFVIILADLFVFMILGVLQMNYDDNYDSAKGEYWSLESMNRLQLIYYFLLQLWIILNLIGIIYIGRKIYKGINEGN